MSSEDGSEPEGRLYPAAVHTDQHETAVYLLPGACTFHFNGSADAQFTIVAGTVNHIR